jgi:F-type H+-transporting ATPase subunit epsilon
MADLTLDILTPAGRVKLRKGEGDQLGESVEVPGVEVPGLEGEMGILPGHIPFITPVTGGVVRFKLDGESVRVAVGAGFLEISEDGRVSILTARAVLPQDVDADAAQSELSKVKEALLKLEDYALDSAEHRKLLEREAWLQAQLRAANG